MPTNKYLNTVIDPLTAHAPISAHVGLPFLKQIVSEHCFDIDNLLNLNLKMQHQCHRIYNDITS